MLRSIPPITSTGLSRSPRIQRPTRSIRVENLNPEHTQTEWQSIKPLKNRTLTNKPAASPFPERSVPEVIEDEKNVWVIVEFPQHTNISEIQWTEEGDVLSVRSALLGCSYQNKIALPKNRGERAGVKFHNGLFIVKF